MTGTTQHIGNNLNAANIEITRLTSERDHLKKLIDVGDTIIKELRDFKQGCCTSHERLRKMAERIAEERDDLLEERDHLRKLLVHAAAPLETIVNTYSPHNGLASSNVQTLNPEFILDCRKVVDAIRQEITK